MGKTKINWADDTWNPVRGCTRVSEGCRNCYAETMAGRIVAMDKAKGRPSKYEGLVRIDPATQIQVNLETGEPTGKVRTRMRARWTGAVAFDPVVLAAPLKQRKPTIYFVNSMSDLFHDGFTDEQIAAVFGVMAACLQHTFILLTKRAQRMREWFEWVASESSKGGGGAECEVCIGWADDETNGFIEHIVEGRWPLPNVILGVSVENQATADERIPHLLATPAAVRAISAEPLLGPIDLLGAEVWKTPSKSHLHWVIAGCESGPNARPCEVAWLRSLRDQCVQFGTPFWLKQARADELGHGCVIENGKMLPLPLTAGHGSERKPGGIIDLPYLDGVQWAQRPVRR